MRLQGDAILSNLGTIDNLKESELEPYLQKLLKSGVSKEKDATNTLPTSDQQSVPEKKDGSSKVRRLSKSTQETLTAIFRKIGSKELSQEVIRNFFYKCCTALPSITDYDNVNLEMSFATGSCATL